MECVCKEISLLSRKYDSILILGNLKFESAEEVMTIFFQIHGLKNLIDYPTCCKNPKKPTCFLWVDPDK